MRHHFRLLMANAPTAMWASLDHQAIRIIGSSVLALAWVACGRADAFLTGIHNESGKPWDFCAGYVIATEAGASFERLDSRSFDPAMVNTESADFDIYARSCVCAATPELRKELKLKAVPS